MFRTLRLFAVTLLPTIRSRRQGGLRPTWSFTFEWTVRMLRRDWDEAAAWPLAAQRAAFAARPTPRRHVRRVATRADVLGGVPVRRFTPPAPGAPRLVFCHGGSYVYGSVFGSHADLCAHLALATSLEVVGVEYRLAPEHPWPAQLDDALAVCRALADAPLVLVGDSAGGHLAAKVAQQVATRALILLSPWVDLAMPPRPSHAAHAAFDIGTVDVLHRQARAVAGDLPVASLALALDPLAALPPTLVSIGGAGALVDDMLAYVAALRAAGVDTTVHVAADMPHDPLLFEALHPAAHEAFAAVAAFIRARAA